MNFGLSFGKKSKLSFYLSYMINNDINRQLKFV